MPVWLAPLLEPICRPITPFPAFNWSSVNSLRFSWAFLQGHMDDELKNTHWHNTYSSFKTATALAEYTSNATSAFF
jgi:hypothetical protein